MRLLVRLVEERRIAVNDRVRVSNRLRKALKQYYPQALEWLDRMDAPLFCDFIERFYQVDPHPLPLLDYTPYNENRYLKALKKRAHYSPHSEPLD